SFDLSNHFDDKMVRIEKYNPEQVFNVVHRDGKSGIYYIKRFTFEDTPIGKRTSIINEEAGSKLIFATRAAVPVVSIDILKGKSQTPDTIEQNLAEIVDVKGMKAQGNRLSPHEVKQVTLLAVEEEISQDRPAEAEKETETIAADETATASAADTAGDT